LFPWGMRYQAILSILKINLTMKKVF